MGVEEGGWGGCEGVLLPHLFPPCNHVSVQLWSRGGVPIGDDSAAKNLTLWAKSEGGLEGPPQGGGRGSRRAPCRTLPTQSDFWMQGPLSPVCAPCTQK